MDLDLLKNVFSVNEAKTRNPLGAGARECAGWASGLGVPARGDTLLLTGCLYQMLPRMSALTSVLRVVERLGRPGAAAASAAWRAASALGVDVVGALAAARRGAARRSSSILRRVARALTRAGVEFALLRDDPYSGAIYHDLGVDDLFESHIRWLASRISSAGARRVITVDPHTTYVLDRLAPEYLDGFDVEVVHYADLLMRVGDGASLRDAGGARVVLHDPCYLARWLDLSGRIREALAAAGAEVREPELSGRLTGCCGGPVEALFPSLAGEVARARLGELSAVGAKTVVVACPVCLLNLSSAARRTGVEVLDLAEVIL